MKLMRTEDAVGQVLCHDITQIIRGVTKDAVFRKGHIIAPEDIPVLLSVGKDHIYVWENDETMYHEDEAAEILRDICMNEGMSASKPKEGKIELTAARDGLFLVNREKLRAINSLGRMIDSHPSRRRRRRAGAKALRHEEYPAGHREGGHGAREGGRRARAHTEPQAHKAQGVRRRHHRQRGLLRARIQDTFTPVIEEKMAEFGCEMIGHEVSNDEHERITGCINNLLDMGCELVLCTGGMSVDPDDMTPLAIKNTGADIVSYGAPVLPGAMFLLSYMGRRAARRGPARLRHVRQADDIRHCPALPARGRAGDGGDARGPRQRRALPQLPGLPLPGLRLRQVAVMGFTHIDARATP